MASIQLNYAKLRPVSAAKLKGPDGNWDSLVQAVGYYMTKVGISRLNETTFDQFVLRMRMVDKVDGYLYLNPDQSPHPISLVELSLCLGLESNAANLNTYKFNLNLIHALTKDSIYELNAERDQLQKDMMGVYKLRETEKVEVIIDESANFVSALRDADRPG